MTCHAPEEEQAPGREKAVACALLPFDIYMLRSYLLRMIKAFGCKETERIFRRERSRKLPSDIQEAARRKLVMLDSAGALEDLRLPPGNRLEQLKGDMAGQWSIRVNDQWRICFVWQGGNAHDVRIVDYH